MSHSVEFDKRRANTTYTIQNRIRVAVAKIAAKDELSASRWVEKLLRKELKERGISL